MPGKIKPRRTSSAVVATYDIFTTSLRLANVPLPNVQIDGKDLSPILFDEDESSPHDCIFHYKGTPGMQCPHEHPKCPGLWAVRCGRHKLHYVTSNWTSGSNNGKFHDPPLIYDLDADPGENFPLAEASDDYKAARAAIEAHVEDHKSKLIEVPNQMAYGTNPDLKVCCDPDSKEKYPMLPECTCNPENFHDVFVCSPVFPQPQNFDPLDSSTWRVLGRMHFQDA